MSLQDLKSPWPALELATLGRSFAWLNTFRASGCRHNNISRQTVYYNGSNGSRQPRITTHNKLPGRSTPVMFDPKAHETGRSSSGQKHPSPLRTKRCEDAAVPLHRFVSPTPAKNTFDTAPAPLCRGLGHGVERAGAATRQAPDLCPVRVGCKTPAPKQTGA